jgi:hypothetical protein
VLFVSPATFVGAFSYLMPLNANAAIEFRASGSASNLTDLIGIETRLSTDAVRENPALHYDLASDDAVAARAIPSLSDDIARTFAGGRYHSRALQHDVVAYRYSGGTSGAQGRFLTTRQSVEQIGSPAAAQRALNLPAGATAEQLNAFVIPRGTTIYYGRVAGGGERATQIFVQDSSVLRSLP